MWSFGETRTPTEDRDYHAYALGWMYRGNDLTAAFARAQLKKLDGYSETLRRNGAKMNECLKGTPGLILPTEPERHAHNWYNYCCRIDFDAIGWTGDKDRFRHAVVRAVCAEGVPVSVWQQFILPAMTVFQAKNSLRRRVPLVHSRSGRRRGLHPGPLPRGATTLAKATLRWPSPCARPTGPRWPNRRPQAFARSSRTSSPIDPEAILAKKA